MAQKRMFDKSIVDSDDFLEMPLTTQALYFHLNMRADDDGFIDNWKTIMKIIGAKEDDLRVLFSKQYIIPFDTGVIVIRHWKINNYLQKDRKKATRHLEEIQQLKEINGEYFLLEGGEISNILSLEEEKEPPEWQIKRDKAYKESSLPYSFLYKIRNAFNNEQCPLCKNIMKTSGHKKYIPTIQHLLPISKGGKHELENIAVICYSCNSSIKDKEIKEKLNNEIVIKKWEAMLNDNKYLSRLTSVNTDKNRIEENRIEENNIAQILMQDFDKEFEELWQIYPNKKGKKDALKHYIKARKKGTDFLTIKQGIERYNEYIKNNNIAIQYIKYGSSWFNQESWNDDYSNKERTTKTLEQYFDVNKFLNYKEDEYDNN